MASKMGVEQITDMTADYIKKAGYTWFRVVEVEFNPAKYEWSVSVDVGVFKPEIKKVIIDDNLGKVVGFK